MNEIQVSTPECPKSSSLLRPLFFFYNSRNKGRRKEGTKKRMEEGRQKDKKTQSPDLDRIGIK